VDLLQDLLINAFPVNPSEVPAVVERLQGVVVAYRKPAGAQRRPRLVFSERAPFIAHAPANSLVCIDLTCGTEGPFPLGHSALGRDTTF